MTSPSCRLMISESVVDAMLGDETVLLNVESGVYFGLDPVGTRIWELLARGSTEDEITSCLLDEYEVEPARARVDVKTFMRALVSKGLTREVSR